MVLVKEYRNGPPMLHGKVAKFDNRIEKKHMSCIIRASRVPDVVTESCMICIHGSSWRRFCRPAFKMAKCTGKGRTQVALSMLDVRAYEARL